MSVSPPPALPVRPDDRFGLLTWNLGGRPSALTALLSQLDAPDCPWAVVLIQEWTKPKIPVTRAGVEADLATVKPRGWVVAATTDQSGKHSRRSALLVRTSHPDEPRWPINLLGGGQQKTVCWARVEIAARGAQVSRRLLVANVHATSRRSAGDSLTRAVKARRTRADLGFARSSDPEAVFVAGGDWNAEPWDDELIAVAGHGAARSPGELVRGRRPGAIARLFNPTWSVVDPVRTAGPAGTYFYAREVARADRWKVFDQFLLDQRATDLYLRGGTVALQPALSGHVVPGLVAPTQGTPVSDHVPVGIVFHQICN